MGRDVDFRVAAESNLDLLLELFADCVNLAKLVDRVNGDFDSVLDCCAKVCFGLGASVEEELSAGIPASKAALISPREKTSAPAPSAATVLMMTGFSFAFAA